MSDGGTLLGSAEFWNVAVTKVACSCVSPSVLRPPHAELQS